MPSRPSIQARDSSGRRVSLLNDEPSTQQASIPTPAQNHPSYHYSGMVRSNSRDSLPSNMSSPLTPGLTRADSFDSNMAPMSPLTPTFNADYGRQNPYASSYKEQALYDYIPHEYPAPPMYGMPGRPQYNENRSPAYPEPHSYEEDGYQNPNSSDRGGKRYPCRFRDSNNCNKTFTTSGHASRHSKIHTAEKGVHCTHEGCPKKFTRADNMKQHLETHNKDKSRSKTANTLTRPAGVRKAPSVSISRPVSRCASTTELPPVDPALLHGYQSQLQAPHHSRASPSYGSAPFQKSPPMTSSYQGLDVLAAAADFTTQS